MTSVRTASILMAIFVISGCSPKKSETLAEGIQSIIQLLEKRDFGTLVRSRYAEIGKAENDSQIESLIEKFGKRFESEAALKSGISIYRSALEAEPELSDDGNTATFQTSAGPVKLSRMANGKWGFHL